MGVFVCTTMAGCWWEASVTNDSYAEVGHKYTTRGASVRPQGEIRFDNPAQRRRGSGFCIDRYLAGYLVRNPDRLPFDA